MTEHDDAGQFDRPLSPVSGRFPLGLGNFAAPRSDEPASGRGVRPFGLRFATVVARSGEGSMESTGPSPDGQGSTGNEEWTPDYVGDGAA
jgi:hypothetical protein